jgi:hypothetical protein
MLWVDTSTGPPYTLKVRNAANTAWEDIAGSGGGSAPSGGSIIDGGNTVSDDLVLGTLNDHDVLFIRDGAGRFRVTPGGTNFGGNLTADSLEVYGPISTSERIYVEGDQVVGHRWVAIPDVASGDAPTAAASYTQADIQSMVDLINELKTQVNEAFAMLRNHGLIAS